MAVGEGVMGLPVQVTAGVMYMNEEKPPSPEKAPLAFLPLTLTLTLILPLTLTLTLILTLTLTLTLTPNPHQPTDEYYGLGGESTAQERDRIERLARFEIAGGVHEAERERAALFERERVRLTLTPTLTSTLTLTPPLTPPQPQPQP